MSLVSISQAARELGLTEKHVRNMIKKNIWPCYHLGEKDKGLRVDVDEIKNYSKFTHAETGNRQKE